MLLKMDKPMNRNLILISILATFTVLLLTACGGKAAGPSSPEANGPTVDPNQVFTSGAQTVVAQITVDAAKRPVPTAALPPTQATNSLPTLQPLGTPGTAVTLAPSAAGTLIVKPGAAVTIPAALPTLAGLATQAPAAGTTNAVAAIPDKMKWVSNVPADKSKIPAGKAFKITWNIQNIGTTTWTTSYSYKHFAGTQLAKNGGYTILKEVKPNTTVALTVDAVAPATPGEYYSLWVLQTPQGINFGRFDITLTVQ
jgi:hypothetical protein